MGYVVEREGRWYAVGYEGRHPTTGKDRRRWHRVEDETAAQSLAAALPGRPRRARGHGLTLARYLHEQWLPAKQLALKPTTFFRYQRMIETYVVPHVGRVPLRSLSAGHLTKLYAHLLESGSATTGPLAPKTVLNVHQLLRKAISDAMHRGLLTRNVVTFVDSPRVVACPEQECWNEAELRTFLHSAGPYRLFPAMRLAATTGMRRGEVGGLRWTDIDFDERRLSVRRSATCAGYRVHVTTNKTKTSRRAIDLDDETIAILLEWRRVQAEELGYEPEYVFTTASGAMVHPHLLSQTFHRIGAAAGMSRIRFHDLRHTHATLLLKAGVPLKVVSERLGHSSPAFTMCVYQHVLPGMQRDAADLFGRMVTVRFSTAISDPKVAVAPR